MLGTIDCFRKWVIVHPMIVKSSEEISDQLYWHFLSQYWKPRWVGVDAGKEFEVVFTQVWDGCGMTVFKASFGYARINGSLESFNREIKTDIRKFMGMNPWSYW